MAENKAEHLPVGEHAEGFQSAVEVPELPESATATQREAHWYRHVYRGDTMKQLSLRAVLMGGTIGMMMSVAGLYTTLKIGWSFGVAITSCVISYVIWNIFRGVSANRLSQMTILENNCMQSTASAAGYSTGSTIATAFGALLLLTTGENATKHTWELQAPWIVAGFTFFTACLGVFMAIPMKRQMINIEQLPFPSGIAAAATLKSLYTKGVEASRKAYALVISLLCGAIVGVLNTGEGGTNFIDNLFKFFREKLFRINLPEAVPEGGYMKWYGKGALGFWFEPSVLLVAAGMIVGLRVSLSMLAGSLILYLGVGPWLVSMDVAAAVPGYKHSIDVVARRHALTTSRAGHCGVARRSWCSRVSPPSRCNGKRCSVLSAWVRRAPARPTPWTRNLKPRSGRLKCPTLGC